MTPKEQDENHKYQSKIQAETKTNSNCHRNAKKRADRARTYKTPYRASNRKIQHDSVQIRQYFRLSWNNGLSNICKLAWKYI